MESLAHLYTLTFEPLPEHLQVFAQGNLAAPETRIHAWDRIIKRCRDERRRKLLVVQDSPGNATPADAYVSSAGIAALGLHGIKIAFADLNPASHQTNQFGELVASNRGALAKVFSTEAEARDWLLTDAN